MRDTVKIGEQSFDIECNAAVPFFAKRIFRINVMKAFQELQDADDDEKLETLQKIGFVMYLAANKPTSEILGATEADFFTWLSGFDWMELVSGEFMQKVAALWANDSKQESQPKN